MAACLYRLGPGLVSKSQPADTLYFTLAAYNELWVVFVESCIKEILNILANAGGVTVSFAARSDRLRLETCPSSNG